MALLAVAGCGGGRAGSTSSQPAADPAGWKRCTNTPHGFSLAYPASWHVASYERLHVLGKGKAYRSLFLRKVVCHNFDPRAFTVYDGSEFPQTAITAWRYPTGREYRQAIRWTFDTRGVRTIQRRSVVVGGHPAIRYHVYLKQTVLYPRSHVYGYLIDFGRRGGINIEGWRYGHTVIPWTQYRSRMAVVDRMAPTAQVVPS